MSTDFHDLERQTRGMQWDTVTLEPDPADVARIDQELPAEWAELDYQALIDQDVQDLYGLTDEELAQRFEIEPGDIDRNAQQALEETNINRHAFMEERQYSPNQSDQNRSDQNQDTQNQNTQNQSNTNDLDIDFGR